MNCGLVFWPSRVCSSAMDLNTWFSLGDRLLDIKISPVNSLYSVKIAADKSILSPRNTWRKSHPFVKSNRHGWANCQVFLHARNEQEWERNGMCSGINCRGRVRASFWVQSDWYLLVTARSKVWGQVLDPLSAFPVLGGALLCAVLWLLMLQLWWDEITYSRWTKEDKFTLNYLWTNSVITRDSLDERNCP